MHVAETIQFYDLIYLPWKCIVNKLSKMIVIPKIIFMKNYMKLHEKLHCRHSYMYQCFG